MKTMSEDQRRSKQTRLLIADDNPGARSGLIALLNTMLAGAAGLMILEASTGEAAVRLAANFQPDLVLMDIQMPEMDGIEAIRQIKQRQPGVKVAALTMFADRRQEALEAGADLFLLKGTPPDRLLSAIQSLLPVEN